MSDSDYAVASFSNPTDSETVGFYSWTSEQLASYFKTNGLGKYHDSIISHKITGKLAPLLSDEHLMEMGAKSIGDRLTLRAHIDHLKREERALSRLKCQWLNSNNNNYSNYNRNSNNNSYSSYKNRYNKNYNNDDTYSSNSSYSSYNRSYSNYNNRSYNSSSQNFFEKKETIIVFLVILGVFIAYYLMTFTSRMMINNSEQRSTDGGVKKGRGKQMTGRERSERRMRSKMSRIHSRRNSSSMRPSSREQEPYHPAFDERAIELSHYTKMDDHEVGMHNSRYGGRNGFSGQVAQNGSYYPQGRSDPQGQYPYGTGSHFSIDVV